MITKIRLSRTGKKGQPHYRLVVQAKKVKRDGKVIELLGSSSRINKGRLDWWLKQGAQISSAAKRFIK